MVQNILEPKNLCPTGKINTVLDVGCGLPFNKNEVIIPQLESLFQHYNSSLRLIIILQYEEVIDKYITLMREAAESVNN